MWDGVIIGGGLAGLIAGIRASENGKKILIVSAGVGSLTYASGTLDFGEFSVLLGKENHPFSVMGEETTRQAFEYFLRILPDYDGKWGKKNSVLTPLGELRRSDLTPRFLAAGPLNAAKQIILVAPEAPKDFFPDVFKRNLEKHFPVAHIIVKPLRADGFELHYRQGRSIPGTDYARYWNSKNGIKELQAFLTGLEREIRKGNSDIVSQETDSFKDTVVIFPGLSAGLSYSLQDLLAQVPFPVIETTLFPPSPGGRSLEDNLKRKFKAMGGELLIGCKALRAEIKDGICQSIAVESKGKELNIQARSFVLAGGGILGGGIQVTPYACQEALCNLPLYVPPEWTKEEFIGEQPYARIGVEADFNLNPIDDQGNVLLKNTYICGRMLAHWDPWTEHCGGGVSLASGYLAGGKI